LGDEYWLDLFSEEVQPGIVDVVGGSILGDI
jgi:hypothetical protein